MPDIYLVWIQRIAETLDIEIKRWAAGKEGNLRALLATLQYVSYSHYMLYFMACNDEILKASS